MDIKKWTLKEIELLQKLLLENKTYKEIGIILGRTPDGVQIKKERCGLIKPTRKKGKTCINVKCLNCEKEFEKVKTQLKKHLNSFCCKSCCATYNNKKRILSSETKKKIGESVKNWCVANLNEKHEKNCIYCDKQFFVTDSGLKRKFCSLSCSKKYLWKSGKMDHIDRGKIIRDNFAKTNRESKGGKTQWFIYKDIRVQGTYELRTCFILDSMVNNNHIYKWEYTNDRIKYTDSENVDRTYLLDFKVWVTETEFYYIEVKGFEKEIDKIKWKAVKDQGFTLEVWFKEQIIEKELFYNLNDEHLKTYFPELKKYKRKSKANPNKINDLTYKKIESLIKQRKIVRPPYEQLLEEIKSLGYLGTGRKYGVSDNTIKNWIEFYEKYENEYNRIKNETNK